ncbi:hypothetical protein ACTFIZ_000809 [Dictyostelium cf. discoideum]
MKIVVSIGSGISFFFLLITTLLIGVGLFCPIYKVQYEYMKYGVEIKDSNYNAKSTIYFFDYYLEYEINPHLGSSIYSQTIDLDFSSNLASSLKKNENQKEQIYNSNINNNNNNNKIEESSSNGSSSSNNGIISGSNNHEIHHNRTNISNYYNVKLNYFQTNSPLYQFLNVFNYLGKIVLFLKIIPIILLVCKMSILLYGNTLNQRNIGALINFSMVLVQIGVLILLFLMVFLLFHLPKVFKLDDSFKANLSTLNQNNSINEDGNNNNNNNNYFNQSELYNFKWTTLDIDTCRIKPFDYYIYFGKCKSFSGKIYSLDRSLNELDYRWGPSKSWFLSLVSTIIEFIVFFIFVKTFAVESIYQFNNNNNNNNTHNRENNGNVEMSSIPSKMVLLNIEIKSDISNEN